MKYFSCQPDTHKGFGLLIGHTLTYFVLECSNPDKVGNSNNNRSSSSHGSDSSSAFINDDDDTLRVCAQYRVTLPAGFGIAPQCFSMASRALYGIDMAIVGASTGVMAVVVMPTSGVVYFPGKSPASLRTFPTAAVRQSDHHRMATHFQSHSSMSTIGASSSFSSPSLRQTAELDRGVGTVTWMRDKPLVFVGLTSGRVEWYCVTIAAPMQTAGTAKGYVDNVNMAATVEECTAHAGNSNNGIKKQSKNGVLLSAEAESVRKVAGVCLLPSNTGTHGSRTQRSNNRKNNNNNGCSEEETVQIRLQFAVNFHETGAFLTSDWFPAAGYVVAGAERAVYIFSSEQMGSPLCSITSVGCSFLSCHPFLPILGCLSFGRSAENSKQPDVCALHVFEWTDDNSLSLAAEKRTFQRVSRHDVYYGCSWKSSADLQLAICNVEESTVHVLHLAKAEKEEFEAAEKDEETTVSSSPLSVLPQPFAYSFTREREVYLPLHSLVNIEFVSTAMRTAPEGTVHSSRSRSKGSRSHDGKSAALMTTTTRCGDCGRYRHYSRESAAGGKTDAFSHVTIDEDPAVKEGAGAFSRIIGVNHAGEIAAISVDTDVKIAALGSGRFAVGFSASVFVVSGEAAGLPDIVQRMKQRLTAGFGVPAAANVRALQAINDPADVDLRLLFAYITLVESVGVVGSSDAVPSIVDLLSLANAPNTTKLMALNLLPHGITVVCGSSTSLNDSRRLLLLHLLNWIPPEEPLAAVRSDGSSVVPIYMTCEQVERAVAVEVLHNQRPRAVALLQRHQQLNPVYVTIAGHLEHPEFISNTLRSGVTGVQECFLKQLSPWLQVVFWYNIDRTKIYTNVGLPLWDRIAIAIITESDTTRLVSILRSAFEPECNMLQQLLLLKGISESTCSLMQRIVDCTGDFQLAACLFARVGARSAAASHVDNSSSADTTTISTRRDDSSHPWELWAAAYRTFLDDEREFVKRNMFDLACRQLQQQWRGSLGQTEAIPFRSQSSFQTAKSDTTQQRFMSSSLLSLSHRHCSVCSSLVSWRWHCAQDSLAWCTACRHGGHANHLQEWFSTHRKCPMYGCSCRCEVGIEPYMEKGRFSEP